MAPDLTKCELELFSLEDKVSDAASDIRETKTLALLQETDRSKIKLFKARLSRLDVTFENFNNYLADARKLAHEVNNKELLNRFDSLRTEIRGIYYEIISYSITEDAATVSEDRSMSVRYSHGFTQANNPLIRLPTINLPTFQGDVSTWVNFKDTFMSLVHENPDITNVQRFHYLKSALRGSALQTVSAIPMSVEGYSQAWASLKRKYDNKRIQATNYIVKIFNYKPLQKNNFKSLESFCEVVLESAAAFINLKLDDPAGFILYTFGLRLLDSKTRERFETEFGSKTEVPTFEEFSNFVHQQCLNLQADALTSNIGHNSGQPAVPPTMHRIAKQVLMSTNFSDSVNLCPYCKERHRLFRCYKFRALKPEQRYDWVRSHRLCLNCLCSGHTVDKCPSSSSCLKCKKRHHSMLHFYDYKPSSRKKERVNQTPAVPGGLTVNPPSSSNERMSQTSNHGASGEAVLIGASVSNSDISVLLGTATAMIQDSEGNFHPVRIIIDSGSQRSFLSAACAKRLGLKLDLNDQSLRGFADCPIQGGSHQTLCTLAPKGTLHPQLQTTAIIIPKIVERAPVCPVPSAIKDYFHQYDLADETFWKPGAVEFLLGADLFGQILTGECDPIMNGYPNALGTIFGWVIIGSYDANKESQALTLLSVCTQPSANNLDSLVQRFWEVESVPQVPALSPEEIQCEDHFISTHSRDPSGRYMVRLPFRNNQAPKLGDSYKGALQRFRKLEYRLDKSSDLKVEYSKIVKEYLNLNYITLSEEEGKYFLPHHCVVKDNNLARVRIVFDASSQTDQGSLNDHLLTGRRLQLDIRHVILNFRRFPFVITADICQMFLQILVHPDDRGYQHFFYRFNATESIAEYQLNRVIFGMSSSPFLAIRVLHQLVQDEGLSYPKASDALLRNTYVDDILTGADTLEDALDLQQQLIALLKTGGFTLKKWSSNVAELLESVAGDQQHPLPFSPTDNPSVKLLGLQWDPTLDCLSYKMESMKLILTKRGILSAVARMFDPLGYISPVVFKAKCYLQRLWCLKLNWDDPIPVDLARECEEFFGALSLLKSLQIPRCLFLEKPLKTAVVGFADASSVGYAASIYLRTEFECGKVTSNLIISKTRLAPLKSISIPRLELCAAVLLVETLDSIKDFLTNTQVCDTYLLSDSSIVLSWIRLPPHILKTFVANRVTMILEKSSLSSWYHVSTSDNAADLASRGLTPQALNDSYLWWFGPKWLLNSTSEWLISNQISSGSVPETKPKAVVLVNQTQTSYLMEVIERYNSLSKLHRVIAYALRFAFNARKKLSERKFGPIKLMEVNEATNILVKAVQQYHFPPNSPSTKSCWESLVVFEDSRGVFRVGGRLKNSPLDYDARHPIVLPTKAHLTNLIIDYYHTNYLHAGPQLLLSLLRRKYWIIAARRIVRLRIHKCVKCFRFKSENFAPMMGDLPPSRFEQGRAFVNIGIDFAGPFTVKESTRRNAHTMKSYICLFVCMSTKAVHAELVSQLTTDAFLACLDRFVARRGLPSKIMSDHGTNFTGAQRHLKEIYSWLANTEVQNQISGHLNLQQIEWEFIPPSAPHFGGLWEAGVKSFKYHLNRVIGDKVLTIEEFNTFIIRAEALLNSRPLYPLSSSPNDLETLTPGHFLIGGPQLALPERDFEHIPSNRLSRWQLLSKCIQAIWNRWRRDYLNSLQQRVKWTRKRPNIRVDSLVLLRDSTVAPLQWPTGRVTEIFPGPDGAIRVVKIKTSKGEYTRPVTKLAPLLPVDD